MKYSDSEVSSASRQRIARIFQIPIDSVDLEHVFGTDLTSSGRSDFKYSELDQILHDIRDVADKETIKEINSGALVICTVGDYCDHMLRCYRKNESEVLTVLGLQANGS